MSLSSTPSVSRAVSLVLALGLSACFGDDPSDGDSGASEPASAMPYCEETGTVLLSGEDDALGLSADAFLAALPAEVAASADWEDGSISGLTLSLGVDADSLRLVSQEVVYPDTDGPVPEIAVECPDVVRVDVSMVIASDDGRLSEAASVFFEREEFLVSEAVALSQVSLDPDGLAGSLDLADFADTSRYDETGLDLEIAVGDAAVSGTLSGFGSGEDGEAAFAELIEVMTFTSAVE